jgi:hypothetical protein
MVEASILPGALVLLCFGLKDDKPAFLQSRFSISYFSGFVYRDTFGSLLPPDFCPIRI